MMFVCCYLLSLNLIAINTNPFPSSPLTNLLSHIYKIILMIIQPGGLKLSFGVCHKLIIIASCQVINEPYNFPYSPPTSISNLSLFQ